MAQREIVEFLKSKPNTLFTGRQISKELNIDIRCANRNLSKLSAFDVVNIKIKTGRTPAKFGYMEK